MTNLATIEQLLSGTATLELPSLAGTGFMVTLQRPNLLQMIGDDGEVLDLLTPIVNNLIDGTEGDQTRSGIEMGLNILRAAPRLEPHVNRAVAAAFVEPALSPDADDPAYVGRLPMRDRLFVMNWVLREEFGDLSRFLGQSARGMGVTSNRQARGATAIPTAGG